MTGNKIFLIGTKLKHVFKPTPVFTRPLGVFEHIYIASIYTVSNLYQSIIIVHAYGIPLPFIETAMALYVNIEEVVLSADDEIDSLDISTGVQ